MKIVARYPWQAELVGTGLAEAGFRANVAGRVIDTDASLADAQRIGAAGDAVGGQHQGARRNVTAQHLWVDDSVLP